MHQTIFKMHPPIIKKSRKSCYILVILLGILLLSLFMPISKTDEFEELIEVDGDHVEQFEAETSGGASPDSPDLTQPPTLERPNVRLNIEDWTSKFSKDIRLVYNRMSCLKLIENFYNEHATYYTADANKIRDNIIQEIDGLLNQHRSAVNDIVSEAERLVLVHRFNKSLKFQYTDVHRLRSDQDPPSAIELAWLAAIAEAGNSSNSGLNLGNTNQFTSINGGTPVPGLPEWQTPFRTISMQMNKNFGDIPVNTSMSAIHLPLPLYPGLPTIMNAIAWTEKLDHVFIKNLRDYAHVHHQYYGSHLGFLRTFPAHKWRIPRAEPDLFDARIRPWYVAGASLPKDVVILVDTSGSMTGIRKEIAKGVVFEILDTLTSNDKFAVLRFSETVTPVGFPSKCNLRKPKLTYRCLDQMDPRDESRECHIARLQYEASKQYLIDHPNQIPGINATYITNQQYQHSIKNITDDISDAYLLPANSRNIRYLKTNFTMPTVGIANFTRALMAAFELLQAYNRSDLGTHCNQAIMLITDGSLQDHQEVFNRYNYPNYPIRVFSYVIGREVGDIRPTKAMACNNRGFYARVINLAEVRDQVQKYFAVLARPMVLSKVHPVTWTHAYGDETYQVLTDWVLETKRRERARIMLNEMATTEKANNTDMFIWSTGIAEYDEVNMVDLFRNRLVCEDENQDELELNQSLALEHDPLGYGELSCHWSLRKADLLISVVKPVYYNNQTTLFFERVLHKNIWSEQETHVRNAQMLGVAAVDLRLADVMKAAPSYLLGPNAYVVLLNHNGFVIHHPDLRALLEDPYDKQSKLLKPFFGSVDLTHIEQSYGGIDSTRTSLEEQKLLRLREAAIKRVEGQETVILKRAVDCRRRPSIGSQVFHYGPIKDTPYSMMIGLPSSYGLGRVEGRLELNRNSIDFLTPSDAEVWTVHPEYKYCEPYRYRADPHPLGENVAILLKVLNHEEPDVMFEKVPLIELPERSNKKSKILCNKELFESLLFDAAATNEYSKSYCTPDSTSTICINSKSSDKCQKDSSDMREKMAAIYGLELSIVATRMGLTRVRVSNLSKRVKKLAQVFMDRHPRAMDEPWYSRVVDWNLKYANDSMIISVPFNAYARLIAKLRQRITQLQPQSINSTKGYCQEEESEEEAEETTIPIETTASSSSEPTDEASKPINDTPVDESSTTSYTIPNIPTADYSNYSAYEILDMIANSSVHISMMQTIIYDRYKSKVPVGVSGLLFDYSTFAKRFFNSTSLRITPMETTNSRQQLDIQVELCPGGECPTGCGYRNDTIDCILVDNNGYVVVAEELIHIGRSLNEYDDRLMQALVDKKFFNSIQVIDYQAICVRNESTSLSTANQQPNGSSSPGSSAARSLSSLKNWGPAIGALLRNLGGIGSWLWIQIIGLLTIEPVLSDFGLIQHEARSLVEAQSTPASLSMLPNKTLLRACEKNVSLYELRLPKKDPKKQEINMNGQPDYYQTRCGCLGWYVAEYVPRTNLIMLIVNTSMACRRCESSNNFVQGPIVSSIVANDIQQNREDQVCNMIEREQKLYVRKTNTCITTHPEESQIKLCGASSSLRPFFWLNVLGFSLVWLIDYSFIFIGLP